MTNGEADGLLVRAGRGDNEALRMLYVEWRSAVFYLAAAIVGSYDDAQDILQDTFIRLKRAEYQGGNAKAYVFAIARNLALTCLRERKHHAYAEPVEEAAWQESRAESATELSEALSTLTPEEKQIVLLHVLGGMKHRETAALLHIPLGTVLWKYQRALGKLRQWLKERGACDEKRRLAPVYQTKRGQGHA